MTRDLAALYQETILEHGHRPRNVGPLPEATAAATLDNPLCGDRVTIRLEIEGETIVVARFEARGCLIAQAAASLLTEALTGLHAADARRVAAAVEALEDDGDRREDLGALEVLAAARAFPARISCVTLAAKAALQALRGR